jgi:hypothetical protein
VRRRISNDANSYDRNLTCSTQTTWWQDATDCVGCDDCIIDPWTNECMELTQHRCEEEALCLCCRHVPQ